MTEIPPQLVPSLKHALYYVRRFKGKFFVVKIGGELVADKKALDHIAGDIAILHGMGIRVVLVHGGGPQVDAVSRKLGLEPKAMNGRRITDEAALDVVTMVLAGKINTEVVASLRKHQVPGVGLTGVDGDLVEATRAGPEILRDPKTGQSHAVDLGLVAKIKKVQPRLLGQLCDQGYVPVLCSLVADAEGQVLNRNADAMASAVASALQAEKLVILSNVPGVLGDKKDPGSLLSVLTTLEAARLVSEGHADGGMIPKLQACIESVQNGVGRTHLISGLVPNGLLLETFTDKGIGTMIVHPQDKKSVDDQEFA